MDNSNEEILDQPQHTPEEKPKKEGFWNSPTVFVLLSIFGFGRGILALNSDRSSTFYFIMGFVWLGVAIYQYNKD